MCPFSASTAPSLVSPCVAMISARAEFWFSCFSCFQRQLGFLARGGRCGGRAPPLDERAVDEARSVLGLEPHALDDTTPTASAGQGAPLLEPPWSWAR